MREQIWKSIKYLSHRYVSFRWIAIGSVAIYLFCRDLLRLTVWPEPRKRVSAALAMLMAAILFFSQPVFTLYTYATEIPGEVSEEVAEPEEEAAEEETAEVPEEVEETVEEIAEEDEEEISEEEKIEDILSVSDPIIAQDVEYLSTYGKYLLVLRNTSELTTIANIQISAEMLQGELVDYKTESEITDEAFREYLGLEPLEAEVPEEEPAETIEEYAEEPTEEMTDVLYPEAIALPDEDGVFTLDEMAPKSVAIIRLNVKTGFENQELPDVISVTADGLTEECIIQKEVSEELMKEITYVPSEEEVIENPTDADESDVTKEDESESKEEISTDEESTLAEDMEEPEETEEDEEDLEEEEEPEKLMDEETPEYAWNLSEENFHILNLNLTDKGEQLSGLAGVYIEVDDAYQNPEKTSEEKMTLEDGTVITLSAAYALTLETGNHNLKIRAWDRYGNVLDDSFTVEVKPADVVSVILPTTFEIPMEMTEDGLAVYSDNIVVYNLSDFDVDVTVSSVDVSIRRETESGVVNSTLSTDEDVVYEIDPAKKSCDLNLSLIQEEGTTVIPVDEGHTEGFTSFSLKAHSSDKSAPDMISENRSSAVSEVYGSDYALVRFTGKIPVETSALWQRSDLTIYVVFDFKKK